MKILIAVLLFVPSLAFADQKADKSRTDTCFQILNMLVQQTNAANFSGRGTDAANKANVKFRTQKAVCLNEKQSYERQYGKYVFGQ